MSPSALTHHSFTAYRSLGRLTSHRPTACDSQKGNASPRPCYANPPASCFVATLQSVAFQRAKFLVSQSCISRLACARSGISPTLLPYCLLNPRPQCPCASAPPVSHTFPIYIKPASFGSRFLAGQLANMFSDFSVRLVTSWTITPLVPTQISHHDPQRVATFRQHGPWRL